MTLHVDVLTGENSHHKVEAAFKATALALREACALAAAASRAPSSASLKSGERSENTGPESTKGSVFLEEMDEADLAARLKGGLDA